MPRLLAAAVAPAAAMRAYPRLARAAIAARLAGLSPLEPEGFDLSEKIWRPRRACFVSLKTRAGDLRGCMGTVRPVRKNLAGEIMANALAAAFSDPRFPPLRAAELTNILFSVDVLSELEPIGGPDELDPARWGVVVSQGGRRGLLLPDLPGVDSAEKQIAIAAGKAGISDLKNISLERFRVERCPEE